jgi:hypothetical protein
MPVIFMILRLVGLLLLDGFTLSSSSGLFRLLSEGILLMGVRMPVEHMPERAILLLIFVDLFLLYLMMLLDNSNFLVSFLLMMILFVSLGASSVIIVSMMSVSESILTFRSMSFLLVVHDNGLLLGNLLTDFTLRLFDFDSKDVYYGFGRRSMAFDTWHTFFELSLLGELIFDPANNSTIIFLKCILFFFFFGWLLSVLFKLILIRGFVLDLLFLVKLCFLYLLLFLLHVLC